MIAVIDTNVLVPLLGALQGVKLPVAPHCPRTQKVIDRADERALALVERIDREKGSIIIPTPVLAEYLVGVEGASQQDILDRIYSYSCIEVAAFDDAAAIECALLVSESEKKQLNSDSTKAKVNFDRQILSIAKAYSADELWTHDEKLTRKGDAVGMKMRNLSEIQPEQKQQSLVLFSQDK